MSRFSYQYTKLPLQASTDTIIEPNNLYTDRGLIEFFELILVALGHNIKYVDFVKMTDIEKTQLLRDIKIKSLL